MIKMTTKKIVIEGEAGYEEDYYYWGTVGGRQLYDALCELFKDYEGDWMFNKPLVRLTLEVIEETEDTTPRWKLKRKDEDDNKE